jgi:hypothetical protein
MRQIYGPQPYGSSFSCYWFWRRASLAPTILMSERNFKSLYIQFFGPSGCILFKVFGVTREGIDIPEIKDSGLTSDQA